MARLDAALRRVVLDDAELAAGCLLATRPQDPILRSPEGAQARHALERAGRDAAEPALKSAGHGLSKGIHDLKHALPHEPKPVLWDGNVVPGRLTAPGGGAVG